MQAGMVSRMQGKIVPLTRDNLAVKLCLTNRRQEVKLISMFEELMIVALIGGVVAIDTTAAFQTMVSQPLSVGTVIGLIFGDLPTGLLVGALLQLIWIGAVPAGGSKIPDVASASVIASAVAIFLQHRYNILFKDACFAAILFAFPVAMIGSALTVLVRRINHPLTLYADKGTPRRITLAVMAGIGVSFIGGAVLTGIATCIGMGLKNLPYSMVDSRAGLIVALGLGVASTMNILISKSIFLFLFLGIALGIVFHVLL